MRVTIAPSMQPWGEGSFTLTSLLQSFWGEAPELIVDTDLPYRIENAEELLLSLHAQASSGLVLSEHEYSRFRRFIDELVQRDDCDVEVFIAVITSTSSEPVLKSLDHLETADGQEKIRRPL